MLYLVFLIIWTFMGAGTALLIWEKIETNIKVHLVFALSCVYFIGIFYGYPLLSS